MRVSSKVIMYAGMSNGDPGAMGIHYWQQFTANDVFGVWALHEWTHRTNPSDLFASWNPRVHC